MKVRLLKPLTIMGFVASVCAIMLLGANEGGAQTGKVTPSTMKRVHDPVQVPGEVLTPMIGKKIENLRVFSWKNGKMTQMVYQIDERLPNGLWIFNLSKVPNAEKGNGLLDPQDWVVFRILDTGDRVEPSDWPTKEGVEIELEDPIDHGKSYCYVVFFPANPPVRRKDDTISLGVSNPWEKDNTPFIVKGFSYTIEGLVNKIGSHYYKTALNRSFAVPTAAGGTNTNFIDGLRIRAFAEFFFGKSKAEFNETSIIGGIDAITQGQIRGYGLQWLTVALPFGLEGPKMYSDVFTYDRLVVSPMQLHVPMDPKKIITRAGIVFGYDLNPNAYGMKFFSPNCPDGVAIDGKMSDKEKAMPKKWAPWWLITGPQGSLIFRVIMDEALLKQTKTYIDYIDDVNVAFPPEASPGSVGYAKTTVEITSVKPGSYDAHIQWYFPPHFYKNGGYDKAELKQFFDINDNPIIIRSSGKTAKNMALKPPALYPKKK